MPDSAVKGTASYSSALIALASASTAIGSGISQAEATLGTPSSPVDRQMPLAASTLDSIVAAARQISALTVAQGYIGRASINLTNAST
jgi:hypothetical protein